jgi:hypothetical protein
VPDSQRVTDISNPLNAAVAGATYKSVAIPIANSEKMMKAPTSVGYSRRRCRIAAIGELVAFPERVSPINVGAPGVRKPESLALCQPA